MKPWHLSIVWGIGFTAMMFAAAAGLFGLSDHLSVPVIPQALTAIGDVVFYTLVARSVLARRARKRHGEAEVKS
jgi:uncharacterized RDD family membrane protein YckC